MFKLSRIASPLILISCVSLLAAPPQKRTSRPPLVVGAVSHLLLPTSAYANGARGGVFKTRMAIYNVTSRTYTIRAGFSTQDGEIASNTFTIMPFQTLTFDNF